MLTHQLAGTLAPTARLLDVDALLTAYFALQPDPGERAHRVVFGTSGHRGSAFERSFNEWHVLAITQAICDYRSSKGMRGPLLLGIDTHALSRPAMVTALEVLAGNGVVVEIAADDAFTPTPALSLAILAHNHGRVTDLADGIVLTPSHNPPEYGGLKYNPPHGGGAESSVTGWIEARANVLLAERLRSVRRGALKTSTTRHCDWLSAYVVALDRVIDLAAIRAAGVSIGVDPLGGAGVHYWPRIAEHWGLNLTVINTQVDPTYRFVPLDHDGRIRMDPSSAFAMAGVIAHKDAFDITVACDADHDRHGIVSPSTGLLPANHYLGVAIDYLCTHRPAWPLTAAIGKTMVSSALIDRVAAHHQRALYEVPVGFKWFVERLRTGELCFGGEESAGLSFLRRDGQVWTTDKDGIIAALLGAEMIARTGCDPGRRHQQLSDQLGEIYTARIDAPVIAAERSQLAAIAANQITATLLAGAPITAVIDHASGNHAALGGVQVKSATGWFAARPSGTEPIYKIYAESFCSPAHLRLILGQAQSIVAAVLAPPGGLR